MKQLLISMVGGFIGVVLGNASWEIGLFLLRRRYAQRIEAAIHHSLGVGRKQ